MIDVGIFYIDRYKEMGVEIYFIRDEIYTFSSDATIKLGIYAGLAASESEKVRERVNAGLTACRQKGVLFGNGNILGYDLIQPDPKDKTKNEFLSDRYAEWKKMRRRYSDGGISFEEYWEWKLKRADNVEGANE